MVRVEDFTLWDETINAVPTEIKNEVPDPSNPELEDFTLLDETFSVFPEPAIDPGKTGEDIAESINNTIPGWLLPVIGALIVGFIVTLFISALGSLFNINIGGS